MLVKYKKPVEHTIKLELISPQFASQSVAATEGHPQRDSSDGNVFKITEDIRAGKWIPDPSSPILLGKSGNIINGKHRMIAIAQSGIPVWAYVARNINEEILSIADTNKPRSAYHVLQMRGVSTQRLQISVVQSMFQWNGIVNPIFSTQKIEELLKMHGKAIDFAVSGFADAPRGVRKAPAIAPIARAYYSQSKKKLTRFMEIMCSGQFNNHAEEAPHMLRDWILDHRGLRDNGSQRRMLYFKTEFMLSNFLVGNCPQRIYEAKEELYLLPDEKKPTDQSDTPKT